MVLNLHPHIHCTKKLLFELEKVGEPDEAGATFVKQTGKSVGSWDSAPYGDNNIKNLATTGIGL